LFKIQAIDIAAKFLSLKKILSDSTMNFGSVYEDFPSIRGSVICLEFAWSQLAAGSGLDAGKAARTS